LAAIADLINREDRPEYIVIETSGVSDPFAVAATVLMPELRPYVMVDSIVTVADAEQLRDLSGEQELLAIDQFDAADIVVLNKVDLVTEAQRDVARSFIRGVTPNARILEVTHGRVPLELLLGVGAYSADRLQTREKRDVHTHAADELHDHDQEHHHHEHTDHTLVFNTVLYQTDQPLSYPALRQAINALPTTIFRAKGFVYLNEAPDRKAVIHIVGRRAALTFSGSWCGKPPKTRLVFIGSHGGVDATHLQTLLDGARLNQTLTSDDKPSEALAWVRKMGPDNQPQEQSS
jgi:G3E family GTPase